MAAAIGQRLGGFEALRLMTSVGLWTLIPVSSRFRSTPAPRAFEPKPLPFSSHSVRLGQYIGSNYARNEGGSTAAAEPFGLHGDWTLSNYKIATPRAGLKGKRQAPRMSQQQKIRRIIMTASIAAITATGAWYGAGLKTKQEIKQETKARREATPMARISQLEEARSGLVAKRLGLERKIAELEAKQRGARRSEEAAGRERR